MELKHPEYLTGILIFALLLFLLAKVRKSGYHFSSSLAVKKISIFWRGLALLPVILYLGTVMALLVALAAPTTEKHRTENIIEGKILVPCIDVSGSMDAVMDNQKTKLAIVREILEDFLKTRSEADAVGLTAFSGGGDGWGAGIIQRPTISKEVFLEASKKIQSSMFGSATAIGEGIFMSVLALNEIEWRKKLKEESANSDNGFDIRRLWAAVNTLDLPEFGLPEDNVKTKDDHIISEAVRLTPPASKNKVIILFSDGDSNTGLDPIKSIWLAQRLGIKVYYIEVAKETPTASADYSNIPEHRRNLVLAVKKSGGEYFRGSNYDDVRSFFMTISRLEKDRVVAVDRYEINESYVFFVKIACLFFTALALIEFITNI